jgi:hypothetical protein
MTGYTLALPVGESGPRIIKGGRRMRNLDGGNKYSRIRKDVARRLYSEGRTIYLTPSNIAASDSNLWVKPYPINNRGEKNFDDIVNSFEYYNCNYELGYYTNFWISEEEEV